MQGHDWLWPTCKTRFLDDLRRLHARTGNWDAVIFSGDLTQKAADAEYEQVTEALLDIWRVQSELGFQPTLIAVPGNHDLRRPDPNDPVVLALKDWWTKEGVRSTALTKPDGPYRSLFDEIFSGYRKWKINAAAAGLPFGIETEGLLPGDVSTTVTTSAGRFGVVGLNSAWLQLDGGDYEGLLSVDVRQLLAVTANDPDGWCRSHDRTTIITHHPPDWLNPRALELWRSEINQPGRFDVHLYGHMHKPDATAVTSGGSRARRAVQAASLFGLEKTEAGIDRTHGYSVTSIDQRGGLRLWPRINTQLQNGSWKLTPDQSLDLEEDGSCRLEGENSGGSVPPPPVRASAPVIGVEQNPNANRVLASLRYHIPGHSAHGGVRRVEQRGALAGLSESRAIWLSAEWGSGSDGFIKSVIGPALPPANIFNLALTDYVTREEFLDAVKSSLGISFQQLCSELSEEGPAYLILDDCPTTAGIPAAGPISVEADIEQVVDAILAFCPQLRVFLRSVRHPQQPRYAHVALSSLDEADLRSYVLAHERGGAQYQEADAISAIFRHTDGVPARIDATLAELEIVSIDQLSAINSDLIQVDVRTLDAPQGLKSAIDELASSKDTDRKRSYALLKALVAFPHGEAITRIKRFYGAHPIFPNHARELLDNALVTSTTLVGGQVGGQAETGKLLTVPRPVREYVRSKLTVNEHRDLTKAAASIYFGDKWSTEGLKSTASKVYSRSSTPPHETANANSIVLRLLNEALDAADERGLDAALNVAKAYINALRIGDHFRNVATLSRDLLQRVPEDREEARAFLQYELGRSLRMLGRDGEAAQILSEVDENLLPATMKRSLLLSQALIRQEAGDSAGAIELAKQILKSGRRSNSGLQARAIMLEENSETTDEQLRMLERECRKSSAEVVANNLAISRAERVSTDLIEARAALDDVLKDKSSQDFYNHTRAIIRKVRLILAANEQVPDRDKDALIGAYHFLYNERLSSLFDSCHRVLWNLFLREGDEDNLFRLFRHSSLIWRLRGDEDKEGQYLKMLAHHVHSLLTRDFRLINKETAYYLVRMSAVREVPSDAKVHLEGSTV